MDLTNLTKKNQEFIHIATNQLIEDGKSDEEIQAILEEVLPTIIENQQFGLLLSLKKLPMPKQTKKRKTITLG